jgi:charged multivesicular body protein 1
MAARIDAVASRVQTAMMMKDVTKQLGGVVQGLDKVMASMDLEKIDKVMSKFEAQFENLDVHTSVMDSAMSSATTLSTPQDQVEGLMKEVAEESGLDIVDKLKDAKIGSGEQTVTEDADLSKRLQNLRDTALESN